MEKELIQQRNKNMKIPLSEKEIVLIENEIGRYFSEKLFDSNKNNWSKTKSDFYKFLQNKSNLVILIVIFLFILSPLILVIHKLKKTSHRMA